MDLVKVFTAGNKEWNITVKGTHKDPLFRATDIGMVLEIKNIYTSMQNFTEAKHWVLQKVKTPGGEQNVKFFTKTGLFKIMMRSRTAFAERFQDWVAEVITEIQETGQYQLQKQVEETQAKLLEFQQEKEAIEARAKEAEAKATEEQRRREELESKMKTKLYEDVSRDEHVYVMKESAELHNHKHKVRKTINLPNRKSNMETSHASPVDFVHHVATSIATNVEHTVHYVLQRYRHSKEFFNCEMDNMIDFTAAVIITLKGCYEFISREEIAEKLHECIDSVLGLPQKKRKTVAPDNINLLEDWLLRGEELTIGMDARVYTTTDPDHLEFASSIAEAFQAYCKYKGEQLKPDDVRGRLKAACRAMGYADAKVHICQSCSKRARSGCCEGYSINKRTKRDVVIGIKLVK